jgi:hypothetical protein
MMIDAKMKREKLLRIIVRAVRELAALYLQEGMTQREVLDRLNAELAEESERWNLPESPDNHLTGDPRLLI